MAKQIRGREAGQEVFGPHLVEAMRLVENAAVKMVENGEVCLTFQQVSVADAELSLREANHISSNYAICGCNGNHHVLLCV